MLGFLFGFVFGLFCCVLFVCFVGLLLPVLVVEMTAVNQVGFVQPASFQRNWGGPLLGLHPMCLWPEIEIAAVPFCKSNGMAGFRGTRLLIESL